MNKKKIVKLLIIFLSIITLSILIYNKFFKKTHTLETVLNEPKNVINETEDIIYNSNIIKDVKYTSIDAEGNKYTITAKEGEIDYTRPNMLYLTGVKGLIELKSTEIITITSNYGKYNSNNFDTIFSKNVIINYLDNKIIGEYLDFSLEKNLLMISRKVVYTNLENVLKADALEMNIKTKDTKIFMYETDKRVNIRSKELNGNN